MSSPLLRVALAVLALSATSCSTDPNSPPDSLELVIQAVSGSGQEGRADQPLLLPLQVRVTRGEVPVAAIAVVWATDDGSIAASGVSDADGMAAAQWTLPPRSGTARARANLPGSTRADVLFSAMAWFPDIEKVSGDRQTGRVGETLPQPLQVRVTREGVPLAGEPVHWSFLPTPVLTGPDGIASVALALGPVAGAQLTAVRIDPLANPGAYFTAVATPGPLAAVQIHRVRRILGGSAKYWSQGIPLDFGLTATDAYGNGLADIPITWSIAGGTGIPGATAVTGPEGRVDVRVTPEEGYRGEIAVRAAAEGVESAPATYPYTNFIVLDADGWGDYLNRSSATIRHGETVRWVNEGLETHTVAPVTGGEGGAVIPPGATFAYAFTTSGTFQWVCTQHGERFTITVTP